VGLAGKMRAWLVDKLSYNQARSPIPERRLRFLKLFNHVRVAVEKDAAESIIRTSAKIRSAHIRIMLPDFEMNALK
jgi:hypothetical protein